MVEAGQVFLPTDAHWLADFRSELFAFPNSKHDDQVDAFSQLLGWVRRHLSNRGNLGSPPEIPGITEPWSDYEGPQDPWGINLDDEGDVYCRDVVGFCQR